MLSLLAAVAFLPVQNPSFLAKAYREDRAGWIYAHLEGSPREIGFEYGSLLANEIDDAHRVLAPQLKEETGKDWNWYRDEAKRLMWSKVDPEYQQEMEGQAEGLKSKGKNYDAWDVLAFNAYIELSMFYVPWLSHKTPTKQACSAFVATGSETKDGKIVMGHNLWWDYQMGERFNAVLDIQPTHGHRIVMDALCGFIHSGSDFAMNDAGLLVCETTLPGLNGFDPNGIPEFVRMRKATQYSNSISQWADVLKDGNNGGYANTWLLGDTKTNEIGRLELGLKNVTFETKKDGAYVGCNFPEGSKLIAEEVPGGWDADPKRNSCESRRARWKSLLDTNRGKVDAEMAKAFLGDTYDEVLDRRGATDRTLCGKGTWSGAINAKVASADMAGKLTMWARMGVTDGEAIKFGNHRPAGLRDIPSQPWILFTPK